MKRWENARTVRELTSKESQRERSSTFAIDLVNKMVHPRRVRSSGSSTKNAKTLTPAVVADVIATCDQINDTTSNLLGYPLARDLHGVLGPASEVLSRICVNNVGDPNDISDDGTDAKHYETMVIDWFADLFRAPKGDRWGYVTSGSTEAIHRALLLARDRLPGAVLYFSAAAHYSVRKSAHILGLPSVVVPTDECGEMDYAALEHAVIESRGRSAIVLATAGTTMTEARDDVKRVRAALWSAPNSHIHADAALDGGYLAFLDKPHAAYDMADGADSVSVSGYKFFGVPEICGVLITKRSLLDESLMTTKISYLNVADTTISGCRSGKTAVLLACVINTLDSAAMQARVKNALATADYAESRLRKIGYPILRNPDTLTIALRTNPQPTVSKRYFLPNTPDGTHIICMPGVTKQLVDEFCQDLERDPALAGRR